MSEWNLWKLHSNLTLQNYLFSVVLKELNYLITPKTCETCKWITLVHLQCFNCKKLFTPWINYLQTHKDIFNKMVAFQTSFNFSNEILIYCVNPIFTLVPSPRICSYGKAGAKINCLWPTPLLLYFWWDNAKYLKLGTDNK